VIDPAYPNHYTLNGGKAFISGAGNILAPSPRHMQPTSALYFCNESASLVLLLLLLLLAGLQGFRTSIW
jgi:hypothetical protein